MPHLSIRDLQKISGEAIQTLPGPTPVKSGERTVGILIPVKPVDRAKLKAALDRIAELAKGRDPAEDAAALRAEGIDPTLWTPEAIRALREDRG